MERINKYVGTQQYFDQLKYTTLANKVLFDGLFTRWDLALDALRENKSIKKFSAKILNEDTFHAIIKYLTFSTVKWFEITLAIDSDDFETGSGQFNELIKTIKANHSIKKLKLEVDYRTVTQAMNILESVKAHPTIDSLTLSFIIMQIPTDEFAVTASILNQSPNLTSLQINGSIFNQACDASVLRDVIQMTRVNRSLTRLALRNFLAEDDAAELLKDIISNAATCPLTQLHLKFTPFRKKETAELMAQVLKADLLESFELDMLLTRKKAVMIAQAIAQAKKLKKIKFHQGVYETQELLPVLKNNRTIMYADFRGNIMPKTTVDVISDVLRSNDTLRVLKFTQVGERSLNELWHSLKTNQSLIELMVEFREISQLDAIRSLDPDVLRSMMAINRSITKLTLSEQITDVCPEIVREIKSFTERNKLAQRLNVTNTLQTIAMIVKSKSFNEKLPREIWKHIYSFVKYPGVVMDFCCRM